MQWINEYQLFLFDFDGLLVDTERLHYQAYLNMCANRGFSLSWTFERFCQSAHTDDASKLKKDIYSELPELYQMEPNWTVLYQEKKDCYMEVLQKQAPSLLPGAKQLLNYLDQYQIRHCVVTNSTKEQVQTIISTNPDLKTIPYWITREDYQNPKPAPDAYITAINQHARDNDSIIGFEDSVKGIRSLLHTKALPVFVNQHPSSDLEEEIQTGKVLYFANLEELLARDELIANFH